MTRVDDMDNEASHDERGNEFIDSIIGSLDASTQDIVKKVLCNVAISELYSPELVTTLCRGSNSTPGD